MITNFKKYFTLNIYNYSYLNKMNSSNWHLVLNTFNNEENIVFKYMLEFLVEETLKYELGETHRPTIEFAISLAKDRRNEELKINKLKQVEIEKQTKQEEDTNIILSPKSKRDLVRKIWIDKFLIKESESEKNS